MFDHLLDVTDFSSKFECWSGFNYDCLSLNALYVESYKLGFMRNVWCTGELCAGMEQLM